MLPLLKNYIYIYIYIIKLKILKYKYIITPVLLSLKFKYNIKWFLEFECYTLLKLILNVYFWLEKW